MCGEGRGGEGGLNTGSVFTIGLQRTMGYEHMHSV